MSELLTVNEASHILHVSKETVRRWIKEEKLAVIVLPHVKNATCRIKREAVDSLFAQRQNRKGGKQD